MSSPVDPALQTAAIATLESVVNRALALSPDGQQELRKLAGCVFAVHCTAPAIDAFLQPNAQGQVRLMGVYEGDITTRVTGSASDFTELASSEDPTATLINGSLEIDGDSAPLIELQKLISALDIDWEAPLVETLGDVVGHQLAQLLRGAHSWSQQASSGLMRQLQEFIHEEARLSPPRLELEDFYSDIAQLTLQVERLQSRISRLRKRVHKLQA